MRRLVSALKSTSLSLRRAWIEMTALAASSSDTTSLSLRRAWIEIVTVNDLSAILKVALLTESVD